MSRKLLQICVQSWTPDHQLKPASMTFPISVTINSFLSGVHTQDLGAMLPPLPSSPLLVQSQSVSKSRSLTFKINQSITTHHFDLPLPWSLYLSAPCFFALWALQWTSASGPLPCLFTGLECSHSLHPHYLWVFMQTSFMSKAISDHPFQNRKSHFSQHNLILPRL